MDLFITSIQAALGVAALLASWRAIRGPTLADRIIALDLILLLLAGGLAVQAFGGSVASYVVVLIVVALVAFAGTVLVARFIEWRDTR